MDEIVIVRNIDGSPYTGGLERTVWRFKVESYGYQLRLQVRLHYYADERRKTTRHKWQPDGYHYHTVDWRMSRLGPFVPAEIIAQARKEALEQIEASIEVASLQRVKKPGSIYETSEWRPITEGDKE